MIALIPAAGYATRLYPLTQNSPKALLEVGNKPLIEHVVEKILEVKQVKKIVVVSNHVFFDQFKTWSKKFQPNSSVPIVVLNDGSISNENRLGAVGDWWFGIEKENLTGHDFLSVSSDNLFNFPITRMLPLYGNGKNSVIAVFDLNNRSEAQKMGVVKIDAKNKVVDFVEKPKDSPSTLASIGIYIFKAEHVLLIKKYLEEGNSPDKQGFFLEWLYRRVPIFGFVYNKPSDKWFDIGTLETLEEVRKTYR